MIKIKQKIKSVSIFLASPEQIRGSKPWLIDKENEFCIETWRDRPTNHGWSYGEVVNSETIDYKTGKSKRGGLFDEVIFGPEKDYTCACGKYKKIKFAGKVCEKCGVEVIESNVRRERMGHIELAAPVAHIWMSKDSPSTSKMSLILDIKSKKIEEVIYFISYIVVEAPANSPFAINEIVNLSNSKNSHSVRIKLRKLLQEIKKTTAKSSPEDSEIASRYFDDLYDDNSLLTLDHLFDFVHKYTKIKFMIGAEALQYLLEKVNLKDEQRKVKQLIAKRETKDPLDMLFLLKRLDLINSFIKSGINPANMIMNVLPVTPPGTRPIVTLDNGKTTTNDINHLYARVIIRNNRLRNIIDLGAPIVIINNEKRLLQEAIDALLDNSKTKNVTLAQKEKRPLKSFTEHLTGKTGLFRQNLLGKRVDYSARSVIAVGPNLKLYEVGLPVDIVLKMFKPFIIRDLTKRVTINGLEQDAIVDSVKLAEQMIDDKDPAIWPIMYEVIKERPVLLNRPPSLHRLSVQAFEVKVVPGRAILLHPSACEAYNADFDGDQMGVYLPITEEAIAEARSLMLCSWHIISPKDGKSILSARQDIVLGIYDMSLEVKNKKGEGMIFSSINEINSALANNEIELQTIIGISTNAFSKKQNLQDNKILITSVGKVLFNSILPSDYDFINSNNLNISENDILGNGENINDAIKTRLLPRGLTKTDANKIINVIHGRYENDEIGQYIDNIKNFGFKYVTKFSETFSIFDLPSYKNKKQYIDITNKKIELINDKFAKGLLTDDERYLNVINSWSKVAENVTNDLKEIISDGKYSNSTVIKMIRSGARGNIAQFTSLLGMRGLMNKSYNYEKTSNSSIVRDTIETPIKNSLVEGVSSLEYFNSCFGARKATADTAMKTSKSGYLTRKLVDAAQDIIITEEDCGAIKGVEISELVNAEGGVIVKLSDRITGRYAVNDVLDGEKVLIKADELITRKQAEAVEKAGIKTVEIFSPIHCKCKNGICRKCYGIDLSTQKAVAIGEPVGIVAAQSIGEPTTQLNMRSKQTGGLVGGGGNIAQGFERLHQILDVVTPKSHELALISQVEGKVTSVEFDNELNKYVIVIKTINNEEVTYESIDNHSIAVKTGDLIKIGDKLINGSIDLKKLLEVSGIEEVREYIIKELQNIYRLQGIEVNDKYLAIIVKKMTNKMFVVDAGDSNFTPSNVIDIYEFNEVNKKLLFSNKNPIIARPIVIGLDDIPNKSFSFLSSASFQYSKQVLAQACITKTKDYLKDIKANVLLGNLIPAGTGVVDVNKVIEDGDNAYKKEW